MGLSAPKNKWKIGDDPNNTKWARNTNTFGQKMLRSQGWEPGQYLGRQGAENTEFHTAASASHIKAVLREENLGIGAAPVSLGRGGGGEMPGECTGLDMFKDLLGRLNGQSEEVLEKKRQARADVRMTLYVERRFGPMRFVRGGLLVGNNMQDLVKDTSDDEADKANSDSKAKNSDNDDKSDNSEPLAPSEDKKHKKDKKDKKTGKDRKDNKSSKKRKAATDADDGDNCGEGSASIAMSTDDKTSKGKRRRTTVDDESEYETDRKRRNEVLSEKAGKKERRKKRNHREDATETGEADRTVGEATVTDRKEKEKKKKKRKDKKEKGEKEKKEKADRKKPKKATPSDDDEDEDESDKQQELGPSSDMASPSAQQPSAWDADLSASFVSGRHLARRRYIAQKRAAVMDPQALKQIFMIKA